MTKVAATQEIVERPSPVTTLAALGGGLIIAACLAGLLSLLVRPALLDKTVVGATDQFVVGLEDGPEGATRGSSLPSGDREVAAPAPAPPAPLPLSPPVLFSEGAFLPSAADWVDLGQARAPLTPEEIAALGLHAQQVLRRKPTTVAVPGFEANDLPPEDPPVPLQETLTREGPLSGQKSGQQGAPASAAPEPTRLPRPLERPRPPYPPQARQAGVEGFVDVSFAVDERGRVIEPEVLGSNPPGVFEETTLETLKEWRFEPVPGQASPRLRVRIDFALEGLR